MPKFYFQHSKIFGNKILAFGLNLQQGNNYAPAYEAVVLNTSSCEIEKRIVLLDNKTINTSFKIDEISLSMSAFSPSGKYAVIGVKPLLLVVQITPDLNVQYLDSRKIVPSYGLLSASTFIRPYTHSPLFTFGKWNDKEVLFHIVPKEMEYNDKIQNMTTINIYENGNIKEPIVTQVIPDVQHNTGNIISWSEPTKSLLIYNRYHTVMHVYKEKENSLSLEKKFPCTMGDHSVCEIAPSPTDPLVIITSTRGDVQQLDLSIYKQVPNFQISDYRPNSTVWLSSGKEFLQSASGIILQCESNGRISHNETFKHDTGTATLTSDDKMISLNCAEAGLQIFKL
jgi:hypothetical protein